MTDQVLHEQWAADLSVRIREARHQLSIALADPKVGHSDERARDEIARAVDELLQTAEHAIRLPLKWPHGRSLLDHWRGLTVVTAYESVHAAEVFLVDLLSDDEIRVRMPSVLARARTVLDADDPLQHGVNRLNPDIDVIDEVCRVNFKEAMRAGFQAEDRIYLRIRTFRNLVVKCTVLLFVLVGVMIWLVAMHPQSMPLCFAPGVTGVGGGPAAPTICPSGDHMPPSSTDIMIVAGLGLLGSAVAAAFSIRRVQGTPNPYDIPVALTFFKLPLGAFTAVTGLLLLGGDFVPGLSDLDNQRQILAYALVFGYAQQLISRLVDERARTIVGQLPNAPATTSPGSE